MLLQQLVIGLTIGSIYALVTIGFNMVYGVLELTNFAHGSFYMLGAYFTMFTMTRLIGRVTIDGFLIALLMSMVTTGTLGALMNKITLEPVRKQNGAPITALLITVGVQTAIDNSVLLLFGTVPLPFPDAFQLGKFKVAGGTIITYLQIILFILAIILMIVLSHIVYRTKLGTGMRAISQNRNAAQIVGIDVNRIITITFFIGVAVAAISGTMVGTYYGRVDSIMSSSVSLKAFAAAVLGGMGSLPGAMLGGIIIGIVETLFATYVSSGFRDVVAFIILFVVLIIRPSGLFGLKENTKV